MAENRLTIRERILVQIERNFLEVQEGVDEHVLTWNVVTREAPRDVEQQMGDLIAITEGTEINSDEVRTVRKSMEIFTEFWLRTQLGDVKSSLANSVMGDVQRTIRQNLPLVEDDTGCQLAIDIVEVRSEVELELEDLIGGVIVWNVVYRHDQDDPRIIGPGH